MANDRKQGKAHWKERAQDELMHAIANAVLRCDEAGEQDEKLVAMRQEGRRVMKLFGYSDWPGLI